jgi:RND family efflux transporter MFP subunit
VMRILVPIVILSILLSAGFLILNNPPELNRRGAAKVTLTVVETMTVVPRDYQIFVNSYGTAQPRTQSMVVSQVSGQIIAIDQKFRPGGVFKKGDKLVDIDQRDYAANVNIAEASLMDALQLEAQEVASADQALSDWQRLGYLGEEPSALVLHEPQVQAAKARVLSARSALIKAQLELERTQIIAPFEGRVLRQMVDLGQVVSNGAQLAEIYATDLVEVRLPLRNSDLSFVNLPEENQNFRPSVEISSELGGKRKWQGEIVRTEGAIDETSRQLHVVAQIKDPFSHKDTSGLPLKIGEYVTAKISGTEIKNSIVIPNETIYQNTYVYIVEGNLLFRKDIEIAWQNGNDTIVSSGVNAGDELVTTPLGQVSSGTVVTIAGERPVPSLAQDSVRKQREGAAQ